MSAARIETMPMGCRPRLANGVRLTYSQGQGSWILLAPERLFKADAIAMEILRRCTGELTFEAILAELAAQFSTSPEQIAGDVNALLSRLAAGRLLEID